MNTEMLGFAISSTYKYIRSYLRGVIEEAGLATEPELKEMFNEGGADAQNVPAIVKHRRSARPEEQEPVGFPDAGQGSDAGRPPRTSGPGRVRGKLRAPLLGQM